MRAILVFRTGQLGDTLVSMPAMEAIRKRYSNHRLVLLTDCHTKSSGYVSSWDVLKPTGWFDDVLFYAPANGLLDKLSTMLRLAWKIGKMSPQCVYDLTSGRNSFQNLRDRFFFRLIAGVQEYKSYGAFMKPGKNSDGILPRVEPEWKRLLGLVDGEGAGFNFRLPIPETEQVKTERILAKKGISLGLKILAVGPGSKMPAKRWPEERFAELGRHLLAENKRLEIVILGGMEDAEIGQRLSRELGQRAHNLAGQLTIYGSASVLRHCLGYVGNDTGTMHLAAMVGVPCVALFSARDYPGCWEPYGTNHTILRHETECAGCMLQVCEEQQNECLRRITVDEMLAAVRTLLKQ